MRGLEDHVGKNIGDVHKTLAGYSDLKLVDVTPVEAAKGADVVFLGMPHKITAKVAMELFPLDVNIVDLSGDFRLKKLVDYDRDYAPGHPCPERLGTFAYGLPSSSARRFARPNTWVAGVLRHVHRHRAHPAGEARLAQGREHPHRRHDGVVGLGAEPARGHASSGALRELEAVQSARASTPQRDRADARRRGRVVGGARHGAHLGAAVARHPRRLAARPARGRHERIDPRACTARSTKASA